MKQEFLLLQEGMYWATVQATAHNAVVQVRAQIVQFNWLEPYQIEEQYEHLGSGFIIDDQGSIITNLHVVNGANHIAVHIPALGKMSFEVKMMGACPDRDIVLLRIIDEDVKKVINQLGKMPQLSFGNSDLIQRAESIMALGYPLGQSHLKSTTGVVSGREIIFGQSLLQITAPINPGSSGGPLLNLKGEVMGVTLATVTNSYNVGYAISSKEVLMILDDLQKTQLVYKPTLSMRVVSAHDYKARYFNNPAPAGLYIAQLFSNSLLKKAGVQVEDMLYTFNGYKIDAYAEAQVEWSADRVPLSDLVSRLQVGDEIPIVVYRKGEKVELTYRVELEEPFAIRVRYPNYEKIEYEVIGGLVIMELSDNHIAYLQEDNPQLVYYLKPEHKSESKLIVTHILSGSYMQRLGILQVGDILWQVNNQQVNSLEQLRNNIVENLHNPLLSLRNDENVLVVVPWAAIAIENVKLSNDFIYPLSMLAKLLYEKMKNKEKE